ncbi:DUF898 family protein [Alphaproteobacteria bacterium]|nr:DUF898 family protein [Alphaproteobacteria bacterium]
MAKPLAKVVIVNIVLNIVTTGFYRFWGKIFEYSGTRK